MLTVWIYHLDDFGAEVSSKLLELTPNVKYHHMATNPCVDLEASQFGETDVVVLLSMRPRDEISLQLNSRCAESHCTFLPVFIELGLLRVGPLVQVPRTPCWECWRERERANHPLAQSRDSLLRHYGTDIAKSPRGYMPYIVDLAACKVANILLSKSSHDAQLGKVWTINVWSRQISIEPFVERHACPHCGSADTNSTVGCLIDYCR